MKLIFAFLLFPILAFGQTARTEYSDSLSQANGASIKHVITDYMVGNTSNWKDYREEAWHIASIYTRYDDTPNGKLFEQNAIPVINRCKLYTDSLKDIQKASAETLAAAPQLKKISDSVKKYKDLVQQLLRQYMDNKERYTKPLEYYIVTFIIQKKGSVEKQDVEVYSFNISPDFQLRSAVHLSKEPLK